MRKAEKLFTNDAVKKKLERWVLVTSELTINIMTSLLAVFTNATLTLNHKI